MQTRDVVGDGLQLRCGWRRAGQPQVRQRRQSLRDRVSAALYAAPCRWVGPQHPDEAYGDLGRAQRDTCPGSVLSVVGLTGRFTYGEPDAVAGLKMRHAAKQQCCGGSRVARRCRGVGRSERRLAKF